MKQFLFVLCILSLNGWAAPATTPPKTDYCEILSRDIQGEHYGFMAGNTLYYVAGSFGAEWEEFWESETIGFTHPLIWDGRARGHGIVSEGSGGTGHDYEGWENWRQTRCAYGTVTLEGETYKHPTPTSLLWRPDRHSITYAVGPATVSEEKFISEEDVLASIITADRDMDIRFEGQSLFFEGRTTASGKDPERRRFTDRCDSVATFREADNVLHLEERGTVWVKPLRSKPFMKGRMRYDGMSFLLSSDLPLEDIKIEKQPDGPVHYAFTIKLKANQPAVLVYSAHDDYQVARRSIQKVISNPAATLQAKTSFFNDLLNEQIPTFRCSDPLAVKTYYYLWSLYFMYFMDIGEGFEQYPHTQTAVNNFMGLHLWDSWAYIQAGSWIADKWKWGHGNALQWQFMTPYKNQNNLLPDNFGTHWYSPETHMVFTGAVEPAWEQYRRSGDRTYLDEVYHKLFKPLYLNEKGPTPSFGIDVNAIDALANMARELGLDEDVKQWLAMRPQRVKNFEGLWSGRWQGFYGGRGVPWKDIWALEALQSAAMPKEWAHEMVDKFVLDTEQGFVSPIGINTRAADSPPNGIFRASTISTWLGIDGMFRQDEDWAGMLVTLNHIKGMVREWGYPVAPEAWEENHKAWGSRYYNWDIAQVCPMIEWLAGIDYSIPDQTFHFAPHLPPSWDFIETYTPVVQDRKTHWVHSRVDRIQSKGSVYKKMSVTGNPLETLVMTPYHEDRNVKKEKSKGVQTSAGSYTFKGSAGDVSSTLSPTKTKAYKTLAWATPRSRIFHEQTTVAFENIIPGTELRYTLDGSEPTAQSPLYERPMTIHKTTPFTLKAFGQDGATYRPWTAEYVATDLKPAQAPMNTQPGLNYKVYTWEEQQTELPDFNTMTPVKEGRVDPKLLNDGIKVSQLAPRNHRYGVVLTGYLNVERDQVYNFHISGDDGARLFIDQERVVDLNTHCHVDPWEAEGNIGLKAGLHPVTIHYYQDKMHSRLHIRAKAGHQHQRQFISPTQWQVK